MRLPLPQSRRARWLAIGAVVAAAGLVAGGLAYYEAVSRIVLRASLVAASTSDLHVDQPVTVLFSQPIDDADVRVSVTPATPIVVREYASRVVVAPRGYWQPSEHYVLALAPVPDSSHRDWVRGFRAGFETQARTGVAQVSVDGQPANGTAVTGPRASVVMTFTDAMSTSSIHPLQDGNQVPAAEMSWDAAQKALTIGPLQLTPYVPTTIAVPASGRTLNGDLMTDPTSLVLQPEALEPAGNLSGIGAGFKTISPLMIVVENSGPARPQIGLQQADMVFEYISEYQISRMTAVYFNKVPDLVGPVRSCRMINAYLDYAFSGLHMCSGASVGTLHWLFGNPDGAPLAPGTINDFDNGGHFFRVDFKYAPHNLYTSGDRAMRVRQEWASPRMDYMVDPPHPDNGLGDPAPAPSVNQDTGYGDGISYTYDASRQVYLRFQGGSPFTMADGSQLVVKNIVTMPVPCHDAGWVEDENGGARSVWYDLLGSGQADIYSDGKVVHGQWHMGPGSGAEWQYWKNDQPMYFTDAAGNFLELNTGLTWIHVIPTCHVYNST